MPVTDFIENIYLPFVKENNRPSTYKSYKTGNYDRHLKTRLGDVRLRDFRTVTGQRIMAGIAKEPGVGHKTLLRNKSFLSGVFKHAKREGLIDFENPMRDVSVAGRPKKFRGDTYTMKEILTMLENLSPSPVSVAAVSMAAFTGLRLGELRGLQWQDYGGQTLSVKRTVWRTTQGLPKTASSEDTVPVLPVLRLMLDNYRQYLEGLPEDGNLGKDLKLTDWIFQGERRGTSLQLVNLVRRVIMPRLTRCAVCHKTNNLHIDQDHEFKLVNLFRSGRVGTPSAVR
jgi:integrase